ncbi:hypothetical protein Pse7429DRAFT_2756 [Pseudanabaena biceps PCC 7429]|uniref:Uncharacterized protein n=1 Tax=Pseudanabaena biceps PCC 7429 TaxID=927668 RepID=L8MYV0_9CYAN|nr:hypothetical protein Pse7429DRAFT_2756 [Pseudanabaena biceps PCC 7429]
MATPFWELVLQQLSIKRTTREFLKALLRNAFKNSLGLGLSAKRCKYAAVAYFLSLGSSFGDRKTLIAANPVIDP